MCCSGRIAVGLYGRPKTGGSVARLGHTWFCCYHTFLILPSASSSLQICGALWVGEQHGEINCSACMGYECTPPLLKLLSSIEISYYLLSERNRFTSKKITLKIFFKLIEIYFASEKAEQPGLPTFLYMRACECPGYIHKGFHSIVAPVLSS